MELRQGRGSWGLGTGAAPEGGGHGTRCPGQWARPRVPEFRERLGSAQTLGLNLGWAIEQMLHQPPPSGLFQAAVNTPFHK